MDTLNTVSASPLKSAGSVQTQAPAAPPAPKDPSASGTTGADTTAASTASPVKPPEQTDSAKKQQISDAAKEISNFFQEAQRTLQFTIDEASGHTVMQIKDSKTNELIRQIPGEDVLQLAKRLDDLTGVLFKAHA